MTAGTVDHYTIQLQQLLPPGSVITREQEATLTKILRAIATELARVDTRGEELIVERDPSRADETLEDWEEALGLPDCANPTTLAARRAAVVAKLVGIEDQSAASYIALTAALGYTGGRVVTRPFPAAVAGAATCRWRMSNQGVHSGSALDALVRGAGWPYVWRIDVVDQADGDAITLDEADEIDLVLECRVSHVAQGHTIPAFLYRLFATDEFAFTTDHDFNIAGLTHPETAEALATVPTDTLPNLLLESGIELLWCNSDGSGDVDNVLGRIPEQMRARGWWVTVIPSFDSTDTDDHTVFTIGDTDGGRLDLVSYDATRMFFRLFAPNSADGITALNPVAVSPPITFAASREMTVYVDGQTGELVVSGLAAGDAGGDDGFLWDMADADGNLYVGKDA